MYPFKALQIQLACLVTKAQQKIHKSCHVKQACHNFNEAPHCSISNYKLCSCTMLQPHAVGCNTLTCHLPCQQQAHTGTQSVCCAPDGTLGTIHITARVQRHTVILARNNSQFNAAPLAHGTCGTTHIAAKAECTPGAKPYRALDTMH